MKIKLLIYLLISSQICFSQKWDEEFFSKLVNNRDLTLSNWGPYSKKYAGYSHIPDVSKGEMFDITVCPAFYHRKILCPNVNWESDYHTWEASPNLDYVKYRYELSWKDKVFADVSYNRIEKNVNQIRIEASNNTRLAENLEFHLMASMQFPNQISNKVYLPDNSIWIDGTAYSKLSYADPDIRDNLTQDGWLRGELRDFKFVNNTALSNGFGKNKGDEAVYEYTAGKLKSAYLILRGKTIKHKTVSLIVTVDGQKYPIKIEASEELLLKKLHIGDLSEGKHKLRFHFEEHDNEMIIDGFSVVEKNQLENFRIKEEKAEMKPETLLQGNNSLILKYKNSDFYYGIYWDFPHCKIRDVHAEYLEHIMKKEANNHGIKVLKKDDKGFYKNILLYPVDIDPNSKKVVNGLVCCGSLEEVKQILFKYSQDIDWDALINKGKEKAFQFKINSEGEKYRFGQQLLSATALTNIVYPIYTQGQFIRHNTPGKCWNSLYTWDSGFIGIGLSDIDLQRSIEILNTYVTDPGNEVAFIHHGSMVPVQFLLFHELWNKTQSVKLLKHFYPRLLKYHDFMMGRFGSSSTRNLKSGLIRTWDYFYNSGGWDDYPPQVHIHKEKLADKVTSVINSSIAIRCAKIMSMAAKELGKINDVKQFNKDIKELSKALQNHSWDEESEYFAYVLHNERKEPKSILKSEKGENFNMGMGGAYPLVAGICSEQQKESLIAKLKSEDHLWTNSGISAVDQSASYFSKKGYWNGTIWFPHQWIFWKSMLDMGESEFAWKIASTALEVWKKETEASYHCMEHFNIETGRGSGWHQFGGLSSPVMSWYSSYFKKGQVSVGHDCWLKNIKFNDKHTEFSVKLQFYNKQKENRTIIITMNDQYSYSAEFNDKPIELKELIKGSYSVNIEGNVMGGILKLKMKDSEANR